MVNRSLNLKLCPLYKAVEAHRVPAPSAEPSRELRRSFTAFGHRWSYKSRSERFMSFDKALRSCGS